MTSSTEFLEHYGIKGMKWGIRRTRSQIDASSDDAVAAQNTKEKISRNAGSLAPLSNKELEGLNKRMQLEKSYNELLGKEGERNKTKGTVLKKEGSKFVKEITVDAGKQILKGVIAQQGQKALNNKVEAALQKKKEQEE